MLSWDKVQLIIEQPLIYCFNLRLQKVIIFGPLITSTLITGLLILRHLPLRHYAGGHLVLSHNRVALLGCSPTTAVIETCVQKSRLAQERGGLRRGVQRGGTHKRLGSDRDSCDWWVISLVLLNWRLVGIGGQLGLTQHRAELWRLLSFLLHLKLLLSLFSRICDD